MEHRARKRFGQNFLRDQNVIDRIVRAIRPQQGESLLEIGPGQGALTQALLATACELFALELDRDLVAILMQKFGDHPHFHLQQGDALKFDIGDLYETIAPTKLVPIKKIRVVGNLPYNISTPLIFHLLQQSQSIVDMHFMLQKEVVERLAASPGGGDYGRLSVMVQYHCEAIALFDVPPHAFYPPPQVVSGVVRLIPYQTIPHLAKNYAHFASIVKEAFSHRRKTLRNSLKELVTDEDWKLLDVDSQQRPEQLAVADYVKISNILMEK